MYQFICYPKCSTCQKAMHWLEENQIPFTMRDIKGDRPTQAELAHWHEAAQVPLKRFFNTSGLVYQALALKEKLPAMTEEEQLALLSTDGMLVKRPLLVGAGLTLVGFREQEWKAALCREENPNGH